MYNLGSFAVIFDDRARVLLCLRHDCDVWNLPGGGVESGELPTEAVIREVEEETGLAVEIERLVGVYGKVEKDELVFAFVCRSIGGKLSKTDESRELRYFSITDIPVNTIPKQVKRIHDSVDANAEPAFRRQSAPSTRLLLKQLGAATNAEPSEGENA